MVFLKCYLQMLILCCFFLCWRDHLAAQSGEWIVDTLSVNNSDRTYNLYIPSEYDSTEATPLVINLHGFTSDPVQQAFISQMNLVADTGKFLVVYPRGLEVNIRTLLANDPVGDPLLGFEGDGWNLYGSLSNNDDIAFISALIDEVDSRFPVALEQVYAAGMSIGGQMVYYLACELNDRIAAFASVAGDLPIEEIVDCIPDRAVPILHVHGTSDLISPFDGGITGRGVLPTIDYWLDINGCTRDSTITLFEDIDPSDISTVVLTSYEDCEANAEVQYYRVNGGGHTWPGGMRDGRPLLFGRINQDINASAEIWDFFKRYTLNVDETVGIRPIVPEDIHLNVYPNPFTSTLNVVFDLTEASRIKLELFNYLGQWVNTFVDRQLGRGNYHITWETDPQSIPTGTYFYRLSVNGEMVSGPLIHY